MLRTSRHRHLLRVAGLTLLASLVAAPATAEVYRVKVKFPWLASSGDTAPSAPAMPDQSFLADCPQSPEGHDLDWVNSNCRRVRATLFNPTEITIKKTVPWEPAKPGN